MLPDFPRLKEAAYQYLIGRISESPSRGLLATIPTIALYEGDAIAVSGARQSDREGLQKVEARLEVKIDDLIQNGIDAFLSKIGTISEEFVTQKEKLMIEKMKEVTKETGNAIDAKGQPLSPSLVLNALEKMEMEFDENGKPKNLVLVMHPDQIRGFLQKAAEWDKDPEYQKMFKDLMERKRAEWRDRESSRELVD
jgi:hypothetical protein